MSENAGNKDASRRGRWLTRDDFQRRFPPSCPQGFTSDDLRIYFGEHVVSLNKQLHGQTGSICEGRLYNHEARAYEPDACAESPHGFITYVGDVWEWYVGRPASDW